MMVRVNFWLCIFCDSGFICRAAHFPAVQKIIDAAIQGKHSDVIEEARGVLQQVLKDGAHLRPHSPHTDTVPELMLESGGKLRGVMATKLGKSLDLSLKDPTFSARAGLLLEFLTAPQHPLQGRYCSASSIMSLTAVVDLHRFR
jgi:hypothetical protein